MKIITIKEHPEMLDTFITYFQKIWATETSKPVYSDCIRNSIDKNQLIPNWYLLMNDNEIVGCCGLITNDFISRMDLSPWLCALFIEKKFRGHAFGSLLIERIKKDVSEQGIKNLYLCTDHIGYYEKYGFQYIGQGFHPWGEASRIYKTSL